jgi:DNA polymerase-3 subunit alpha
VFARRADWTREEKLQMEKALIGFYFSGHPLDDYKEQWKAAVTLDLAQTDAAVNGKTYVLLGQLRDIKKIPSRGGFMGFAALSDDRGQIDLTFFTAIWERFEHLLENDAILCVRGKFDNKRGKAGIVVEQVYKSGGAAEKEAESALTAYEPVWKKYVRLNLADKEALRDTTEQTLIGEILALRPLQTKNGKRAGEWMAFGTLRDFNGEIDLTFFPAVWAKCEEKLEEKTVAALKGKINRWNDKISFRVSKVLSLERLEQNAEDDGDDGDGAPAAAPAAAAPVAASIPAENEVHIRLACGAAQAEDVLLSVRDTLFENQGACVVFIHIPVEGRETVVRGSALLKAAPAAAENLRRLSAVADVWYV